MTLAEDRVPLHKRVLRVAGHVSDSVHALVSAGLAVPPSPLGRLLFIGFAYADLPIGKTFTAVFLRHRPREAVATFARIEAVTQQWGKSFPEIPHGWKTVCVVEFPHGVPALIDGLPVISDWYESEWDIGLANDETIQALIFEEDRWDDLLGPFYSTAQMAEICGGISRQALADRRGQGTILGAMTAEDVIVYPTFQFDETNQVVSGLPEVLQCFRGADVDDWTLAGWLVSPLRALGGRSVVDWLRSGRELEPVLVLARDAARRFSE